MRHEIRSKRVLVAGMGKSGLAAVALLQEHGAVVLAADQRTAAEVGAAADELRSRGVELRSQTEQAFTDVDLVVLSPGVPADAPPVQAARQRGISVIGEVELAGYFLKGRTMGITGSNGKTTTTAMAGHLLRTAGVPCQVGGNIGMPPTAMVAGSRDGRWNVLELSSFQTETLETFSVDIAAALNVTPDHLDRHGSFERYADAKGRMFDLQESSGKAVLNADDPVARSYAERTRAEAWWFSRREAVEPGAYVQDGAIYLLGRKLLRVSEIPLRGTHNVENTMAAAAMAHLAGAEDEAIAGGIRSFAGVEHRIEFVRERGGVAYYNDSKATNVDAAEKAIDAFEQPLWIILGGKDKGSDYTVLRSKLVGKARALLLIGAAAHKIAEHLEGLPMVQCETLARAVEHAGAHAQAGEIVLLAPACASFDQFNSYEHRGTIFKELVRAL
jgi:UDP-N-acetylmuramoylalanine--D-glutamate ligase